MLKAGYKHNVIPGRAEAYVDGRFLPGYEEEFAATLDELLGPNVTRESLVRDIALQTDFTGSLVEALTTALLAEDPGARHVQHCLLGGTAATSFRLPGIPHFGSTTLLLPPQTP